MQETLSSKQQKLDWLNARLVHPRQRIILLAERLHNLRRRLRSATVSHIQAVSTHLAGLRAHLSQLSPAARVGQLTQRFTDLDRRFHLGIDNTMKRHRQRLAAAIQNLNTLSPLATLERGYAIVEASNAATIIRDARDVKSGDGITAKLARGRLGCVVQTVDDE
jgi:exodeoxyribonuclease VII large subunit